MEAIQITTAEISFGAATVLIALSLLVLRYAWQYLEKMLSTLPQGRQRVRFNLTAIQDNREKYKAELIKIHFIGCIFFGVSIFLSAIGILGVSSVQLGLNVGYFQQANFEAGIQCVFWSAGFFVTGLFMTGFAYIGRIVSAITGRPNILTVNLEALPTLPANEAARGKTVIKFLTLWFIIFLIITFIGFFNVWISFFVSIGITALVYLAYRTYKRLKH